LKAGGADLWIRRPNVTKAKRLKELNISEKNKIEGTGAGCGIGTGRRWFCLFSVLPLIIVFMLFLCSTAFAQGRFFDVADTNWALKYITKMSVRGVVKGYDDGTFRPNKPVNQVEALKMTVLNMGLQDEVEAADTSLSISVSVPEWAKAYAIVGLNHGLIVPSENRFQWDKSASRAWVAQLMVRMIDKERETSGLNWEELSFADARQIPVWAKGYVAVAVKYGLIKGYEDNTFKPDRAVSRAEMVTLLSRAEKYLDNISLNGGHILSISDSTVSISNSQGQVQEYTFDYNTLVFDENGKINPNFLRRYDKVSFIVDSGRLKYLEVLKEQASIVRGELQKIYPEENTLVIEVEDVLKSVELTDAAVITTGHEILEGLESLHEGDQVEVTVNGAGLGTRVRVLQSFSQSSQKGIVYDIDSDSQILTIKDSRGKLKPYRYASSVKVEVEGKRFPGIEDIRRGDVVQVEVENNLVTSVILVQKNAELNLSGVVEQITPESRIVTIKDDDGQLHAFIVEKDAGIQISGLDFAGLSDVRVGDEIEVEVEDNKIVSLAVKGREAEEFIKGTLIAIDAVGRVITLKEKDEKVNFYRVSEQAEIILDESEVSLEDMTRNINVIIQLVDDEVIYLECKNTIEGTIVRFNDSRNLLVLERCEGGRETFIIDNDADVDIEDESADIEDVQEGDYVEIRVENDKVTDINVQRTLIYIVERVYEDSDKLKVEDEDGDSKRIYLRSYVELLVPGLESPGAEDVREGDLIKATYLGHRLQKVEVVPVLRGEITDINIFNNEITVRQFDGKTSTVIFNEESKIFFHNRTVYRLDNLAAGDRVQVRENIKGGQEITVMEKVSGKFYSVNGDGDKIYLQRDPVTWEHYDLCTNVYIHEGTQSISFRNIEQGDNVDLYILDDTVYEVEVVD